jgi:two-component system sensor histidine kinase RegB
VDRPLLALTRQKPLPSGPSAETTANDNMRQLIQLRWIAVAGQLITILAVHLGFGVPLPLLPMLAVIGLLSLANLGGTYWLPRHVSANLQVLLALLLDTAALTAQLYLSGGAANPFISLYLLHVVLGAILLEAGSAWILVGVTTLCYAGLTVFNVALAYPVNLALSAVDLYRIGAWMSFALIGVLLTLFITRISRNLRARNGYLADLRRHAAEEDSIIRMGLFASGAAHELGTPLASLSVILNDWRRIPHIAKDPMLVEEIGVMEAEIQRCKTIVSNILDSAGEPRGEAMNSVDARHFIDELTAAWRLTHPKVDLNVVHQGVEGAVAVSSPALRQAVWNLLDNAAEASPHAVMLHAEATGEGLAISVRDAGPGFAPAQLSEIGKPLQSSKGPGHGVGLFLAANAVRKLGGRLEASNHAGGGAQVRVVLPLAAHRQEPN